MMEDLITIEAKSRDFSGAVRVTLAGTAAVAMAFGDADRAAGDRNTVDTRFGIASGTKFLTALTAGSLIEDGLLALDDRLVDLRSASRGTWPMVRAVEGWLRSSDRSASAKPPNASRPAR